jgi:predicted RNA binding protein YcfA (HicA-like mRNA interferase family)
MPSLSELPSNFKRRKLTKALERLGYVISTKGGKGDHIKATCVKTQKCVILPDENLSKQVLNYVIKEIEGYSDIKWEDIKKLL